MTHSRKERFTIWGLVLEFQWCEIYMIILQNNKGTINHNILINDCGYVWHVKTRPFFNLQWERNVKNRWRNGSKKENREWEKRYRDNMCDTPYTHTFTRRSTQTLDMLMSWAVTCEQFSEWVLTGRAVLLSEAAPEPDSDQPRVSGNAFSVLINFTSPLRSV